MSASSTNMPYPASNRSRKMSWKNSCGVTGAGVMRPPQRTLLLTGRGLEQLQQVYGEKRAATGQVKLSKSRSYIRRQSSNSNSQHS